MPPKVINHVAHMERYWTPEPNSGCWIWIGARSVEGYGNYRGRAAHRFLYEELFGKVPEPLQLDHICNNTSCINPDHLRIVTPRQNWERSAATSRLNALRTTCANGHPYDYREAAGGRRCRLCRNAWSRARYAARGDRLCR